MWISDFRTFKIKKTIEIHTSKKRFSREVCGSAFSWMSHLKRHAQIHKGEKPFSCKVCESAFSEKSSLKNHIQTNTGGKIVFL